MGRKFTIPYGLYKASGFVNPFLAEQTGFDDEDLDLLFTALENAFQFDQSAARPWLCRVLSLITRSQFLKN